MSWTCNGRTYHDYSEYQRALRSDDNGRARREMNRYRRQVTELNRRLENRDAEIAQARQRVQNLQQENERKDREIGQVRETAERARQEVSRLHTLLERQDQDMRELAAVQSRMQTAQRRFEQRVERDFDQAREHMRALGQDVNRIEADHARHMEEVRQTFDSERRRIDKEITDVRGSIERTRTELRGEIAQTEQVLRRAIVESEQAVREDMRAMGEELDAAMREGDQEVLAEAEAQVKAARQEADEKINAEAAKREELEKRLATEKRNHMDAALARCMIVESLINAHASEEVKRLGMDEEAKSLGNTLKALRGEIQAGQATPAYASSVQVMAQAKTFDSTVHERRARLESERAYVKERIDVLREQLANKESEEGALVHKYFATEVARVAFLLNQLEQGLDRDYADYRRIELEPSRNRDVVRSLGTVVDEMIIEAPNVLRLEEVRRDKAADVSEDLERIFGEVIDLKISNSNKDDLKSPLVLEFDLGTDGKTEFMFTLDGQIYADGYGYHSDGECHEKGRKFVQNISDPGMVRQQATDTGNRQTSSLARDAGRPTWEGVGGDLDRLEQDTRRRF